MKKLFQKYNHILTLLYLPVYLIWFAWLERREGSYTLISMPIDYEIPFCEYFILPYLAWFLFVPAILGYLFFYSKEEYLQACALLFSGMTIFLILCTIWPNGLNLRQDISYHENFCAKLVQILYKTDTSTNVFPSLHVFNTLGCLIALYKSKGTKGHPIIVSFATILGVLIILATMFLKQHSVWDVIGAFVLAAILYCIVYLPSRKKPKAN
ncbi:MAG: phosphatase PAP2 family protein [Wujia sp.]